MSRGHVPVVLFAVGAAAAAGAAPGVAAPGVERPRAGALHPPLPPGPALPCLRAGRGEGTAQTGRGMRHAWYSAD